MKVKLLFLFALAAWASQAESVIAPGATLHKLAGNFKFTEGPTCDASGSIYFTDQPNDRILKWSVRGKLSTRMQPAGRANGLIFDARGNLVACTKAGNQLWSIAPDKTMTVLVTNYQSLGLTRRTTSG